MVLAHCRRGFAMKRIALCAALVATWSSAASAQQMQPPFVFGVTRALPPAQSIAPDYAPPAPTGSALSDNATVLPKTAARVTGGNPWAERLIVIRAGDTLSAVLRDLGATAEEARAIAVVLGTRVGDLKEGQNLRVLLSPVRGAERLQPVRVTVVDDGGITAVVALSDMGRYVSVAVPSVSQP